MTGAVPACRLCGHTGLLNILSLGSMPLANALLARDQLSAPEPVYPLDLVFCPACSLAQITETVSPDLLFREYPYFSSFSDTTLRHAEALVASMIAERGLNEDSLVVEIASNDGYLLQYYRQAGIPVLGVEPAVNVAHAARTERGIPTLCEFFGEELTDRLRCEDRQADVIHAHNVLAHVADLNGVVSGIRGLLKSDGIAVIEVPYVKNMIENCEFDTIYHEHLCYFSLTALDRLLTNHGLVIREAECLPIHGGSLRLRVSLAGGQNSRGLSVTRLLAEETACGVATFEFYRRFAERVENLRSSLRDMLIQLKREGKRLAAYGASAKGSTLLNFCGIGRDILDFTADRSGYKQGRYMPGTHIPVVAPEKLLEVMPDYALLLTWNFAEEILSQQAEYRRRGGRFIIPVPAPKVV